MRHVEVSVGQAEDFRTDRRSHRALQDQSPFIFDAIGVGLLGVAPDGRITFDNRASASMLGHAIDELIGRVVHEAIPHQRGDGLPVSECECPICNTMRDGTVRRVRNVAFRTKDGSSLAVDYVVIPSRDKRGEVIGATVAFTDTAARNATEFAVREDAELPRPAVEAVRLDQGLDGTERVQAEKHVRFQASLLEAVGEAVIATCRQGRVLYWNSAAAELYGWSAAEAMGRSIVELTPSDQSRDEAREIMAAIQRGDRWSGELVVQRSDGTTFPAHISTTALFDDEGNVTGVVGVSRDLTQRKALEEKLQLSQRLEAVGRMAGGIAHDFNNVLTVIKGNAELLRMDLDGDAAAMQSLHDIETATRRASNLTRDLLAFSRQQVLQPEVISLAAVIGAMRGMLEMSLRENIELAVNAPEIGYVRADPTQVTQVILNLSINARDAMPDGGLLSISLTRVEVMSRQGSAPDTLPPGRYLCLTVSDTGVGMDAETKRRIWEPFFTTKSEGTGLGLPSVYGFVRQSGGVITVQSELDQGTTFTIHLPAVDVEDSIPTAITTSDEAESRSPATTGTLILCDDQEPVRKVTRRVLERAGYRIEEAVSGAQALSLMELADGAIDLLITDVVMPRMGGRELVARVRERWPGIKVLMMSGYAGDDSSDAASLEFDTPFLMKPFSPTDLLAKVKEVLG